MEKCNLGIYLEKKQETQEDFAARCSEIAGWTITQPQVSRWIRGVVTPGPANKTIIELATDGEVSKESW